jgi:hypothetical protein
LTKLPTKVFKILPFGHSRLWFYQLGEETRPVIRDMIYHKIFERHLSRTHWKCLLVFAVRLLLYGPNQVFTKCWLVKIIPGSVLEPWSWVK